MGASEWGKAVLAVISLFFIALWMLVGRDEP